LDITRLRMEISAKDSADLAKFADESRLNNHGGHDESLVLGETSTERFTNSNTMSMICHAARLKGFHQPEPATSKRAHMMRGMELVKVLKTTHARVQPVGNASARKRYDR
jgi:hypothetical protein